MKEFINRRPVQICVLVLSTALAVYAVSVFIGIAKETTIRRVIDQMAFANEKLQKSTPGIERMETFIHQLKAIDTSATPSDFRVAFSNYVASLDNGMNEVKSTHSPVSSFDGQVAENRKLLLQVTKQYLNQCP